MDETSHFPVETRCENLIESTLMRQGNVVDRWRLEMLPDGRTMKITQYVLRPSGKEFRNSSVYQKTA